MTDREQWLQRHAFYCPEHEARISPAACASYRRGTRMLNCNVVIVNAHCRLCEGPPVAQPLPPIQRKFKAKFSRDLVRPTFIEQGRKGSR